MLVEQHCNAVNPMHADAGGRKLEGEGDTVESTADLRDDRRLGIGEFQRVTAMGDLPDEQLHRRVAERLCRGEGLRIRRRARERR